MSKSYYQPEDLLKFGSINEWNPELGKKFFDYYQSVFKKGTLSEREKSLIALAVAHTIQCPYCIDAYTTDGLERGIEKEEMMEAIHVAGAIRGGASLVHTVQAMNIYNKLSM
ncbi:MAG: arsenosugar biosynthesis-associated peroxidase-like protein [Flavobacteriaceae bacterium]|nr:arsenosugar biosynthesis-associated peroxidase-like protein [Flavobacteriaceae bacterium]